MKFVHIADTHLDMPFRTLSDRAELGEVRRVDQRKALKKMIEYIKDNKVDYLFIAGDLYDHEYVRESTINYINNLFKEIPQTKIYITPGNHDPYLINSYYKTYKWSDNVKIFSQKVEKVDNQDNTIYGYGFEDFYLEKSDIENIQIEDKEKINILITHGNIDGSKTIENKYNNISSKKLKEMGFDYVALGHIHKRNTDEDTTIIYPGSTISLGFDELGKHGMVVGNIEKGKIEIKFVPLDEKEFKEIELDISKIYNIEELLQALNEIQLEENKLYKIIFVGQRNFEINTYKILKMIENKEIIKLKDKTKLGFNLDQLSNESTLKGIFVKEMLEKLEKEPENKEIIEKALEIGLEVM